MTEKLTEGAQICYNCNSTLNNNCKAQQLPINVDNSITCESPSNKCYIQVKNNILTRGCVGDSFVPQEKDCLPSECILCNEHSGCNNKLVKAEVCVSCDSTKDSTCKTIDSAHHPMKICPLSITSKGCYHSINQNDGQTKRGCASNLLEEEKKNCENDSNECKICHGLYCNKRNSFSICIHCTELEDPNCALKLNESLSKTCKQYGDECFSHFGENGISRGCLQEQENEFVLQCQSDPLNCKICLTNDGKSCNDDILQMETCIECDSDTDVKCRNESETLMNKTYSTFQKAERVDCYLSITNDTYKRGSVQDLKNIEQKTDCLGQSDTCKTCVGANCNKKSNFQQCINCTNSDDPHCMNNAASSNSITCKDYLSSCFTMKKGNSIWFLYHLFEIFYNFTVFKIGKSVRRGCLQELQIDELEVIFFSSF